MHYGGMVELAVYGVVVSVSALFHAFFGGVGQAIQPLVSTNYGAKNIERVKMFWKMSLMTSSGLGIFFICISNASTFV